MEERVLVIGAQIEFNISKNSGLEVNREVIP